MNKDWYKSKAVWVSIEGVVYVVTGYFSGALSVTEAIASLQVALGTLFVRLGINK